MLCLRMTVTIQQPNHNTVSLSCHRHSLVVKVKLKQNVNLMKRDKYFTGTVRKSKETCYKLHVTS